jgi:hypothetical protein
MAMKWYKPEDREPAFDLKYPLWNGTGIWIQGHLEEIKTTAAGTDYVWTDSGLNPIEGVTHYLVVEPPKNNQ